MRLLWVENHAAFVRMASRQFLSTHELTVVPSLASARAAFAEAPFDAVLVDYDLDDGKGTELVAIIGRCPNSPVMLATSAHVNSNSAFMAA